MSSITTHVLDTGCGRPAAGVPVTLEIRDGEGRWTSLGAGSTDQDGRLRTLLAAGQRAEAGTYRLVFDTEAYFRAQGTDGFYPEVSVVFVISRPEQHYHVPLLLSRYGYSTYRGS